MIKYILGVENRVRFFVESFNWHHPEKEPACILLRIKLFSTASMFFFVLTSQKAPQIREDFSRATTPASINWEWIPHHNWYKSDLATITLPLHPIATTYETCNCSKRQKRERDKPRELPLAY
jgi:hypothetical protein